MSTVMLFATAAIVFGGVPGACDESVLVIARAQRVLFIDPDEAKFEALKSTFDAVPETCRRIAEGSSLIRNSRIRATYGPRVVERKTNSSPSDWAHFDEMLPDGVEDRDPRKWPPQATAKLVRTIRQLDSDVRANRSGEPRSSPSDAELRARAALELLGRIGYRNALQLVGPGALEIPGLNAPSLLHPPKETGGYGGDPLPSHFPLERTLLYHDCERELESTGQPSSEALGGSERRKWGYERERCYQEAWNVIDAAAPSPDLTKVRALLDTN